VEYYKQIQTQSN